MSELSPLSPLSPLLSTLKADLLKFRKDTTDNVKHLAVPLSTLVSEAEMLAKNAGNRAVECADVVKTLKKTLSGLEETVAHATSQGLHDVAAKAREEIHLFTGYLPKAPPQLTEEELAKAVSDSAAKVEAKTAKEMGLVMAELKTAFEGRYNPATASAKVKEYFAQLHKTI